MKAKEYALCKKNGVDEIVEITVGNDGITLAYSKDAAPVNFTKAQLWQALAKNVVKDGNVVPNPHKIGATLTLHYLTTQLKLWFLQEHQELDAWGSLVMKKGIDKASKDAKIDYDEYREDGAVIEVGENDSLIIQKLVADKEMFGFFGRYFLAAKDKLQAASIEGQPSLKAIQDYIAAARPLFFYVKKLTWVLCQDYMNL